MRMKIGQVSELTGLSERTIRFYESELLIRPATRSMNSRRYRDYSQADVDALSTFAVLRRAFFSIQEIRDMMEKPDRIPEILAAFKAKSRDEARDKARIVETLDRLDVAQVRDITALSTALQPDSFRFNLPPQDSKPHFGRFDGITKEEREQAFQEYLQRGGLSRGAYRAKVWKDRLTRLVARKGWIAIGALLVALLAVSFVLSSVSTTNAEYRRLEAQQAYGKWQNLREMFEKVDGYDFQRDASINVWMQAYVNTVCYEVGESGLPDGTNGVLGYLLLPDYDSIFREVLTGPVYYREEAERILKDLNGELLLVSRSVTAENDEGMEKLLDAKSVDSKELQAKIGAIATKYAKILQDFNAHDGIERS